MIKHLRFPPTVQLKRESDARLFILYLISPSSFGTSPFHAVNTFPIPALAHLLSPFMRADRQPLDMWTKVQSTANLPFSQELDRLGEKHLAINPMKMFIVSCGMPVKP